MANTVLQIYDMRNEICFKTMGGTEALKCVAKQSNDAWWQLATGGELSSCGETARRNTTVAAVLIH